MRVRPDIVGLEGFLEQDGWLLCVLTGCRIERKRFDQDVAAYLRAYYDTAVLGANEQQLEQADRDTERHYRRVLEEALRMGDGTCGCGVEMLTDNGAHVYLCPACRITVPGALLRVRR